MFCDCNPIQKPVFPCNAARLICGKRLSSCVAKEIKQLLSTVRCHMHQSVTPRTLQQIGERARAETPATLHVHACCETRHVRPCDRLTRTLSVFRGGGAGGAPRSPHSTTGLAALSPVSTVCWNSLHGSLPRALTQICFTSNAGCSTCEPKL